MRKNVAVMDIECYENYFLVAFRDTINPERTKRFEYPLDKEGILKMLKGATIITFNGRNYDMPLLAYALEGATTQELKAASDFIIKGHGRGNRFRPWDFYVNYECQLPEYTDHIDIFEVAAGVGISLKKYAARLGCKKLQDLPINPDAHLTEHECALIAEYCDNDTANTVTLFKAVSDEIAIREEISKELRIDVRSKSDAQIGETYIKYAVERKTGKRVERPQGTPKPFKYNPPRYLYFETPELQDLFGRICNTRFVINTAGQVQLPEFIDRNKISIKRTTYTLGIGGIHSNEKGQAIVRKPDEFLLDVDVGSYYPSMIIDGGFYPQAMGTAFNGVFRHIRDSRLAMKHDKTKEKKVKTYKIVLNGSFGKLGSPYSCLYAPKMLIQTTVTGQLSLLMLIERMEMEGISVVSANTDGIVLYGHKDLEQRARDLVALWEIETGLTMEFTEYDAIYSMSVNDYFAIKPDGSVKRKGAMGKRSLTLDANREVCVEAAIAYLQHGTPIREYIRECKDFLKFTSFQQVNGGAEKDGEYLGKVVRWYYSTQTETPIRSVERGAVVSMTRGAMPCMELPDSFPDDVDYDWYVRESYRILHMLGVLADVESSAMGLGQRAFWGAKEGQKTLHLINPMTGVAYCGATRKDIHSPWNKEGDRHCKKCEVYDV